MPPLTLDVDGRDVTFDDPGAARAAARRWSRMARELGTDGGPDVRDKVRELRARSKAASDWARANEDRATNTPATTGGKAVEPAGENPSPARRRAAAALAETGITRARRQTKRAAGGARKATRRYERAGGADVSGWGDFVFFFFGSIVGLVLLEDVLSSRGSSGFTSAVKASSAAAHRVIAPVPIVNAN